VYKRWGQKAMCVNDRGRVPSEKSSVKMKEEVRRKILSANVREHQKEALYYNTIHREIYNRYEQKRCTDSLVSCAAGLDRNGRCLDVGAGTGNIASKLQTLGFNDIVCVDISPEMLAVLREATGLPAERTVSSDIDSYLDVSDERYSLITMSAVVHHLPDYETTLRRLFDRLVEGGVMFITHEPCRAPRYRQGARRWIVKAIRKTDYYLYVVRYVLLIAAGKLKYIGRDCSCSDYYTGQRAVSLERLTESFAGHEVEYRYFTTGRSSLAAALLNRLTGDALEIVVRKKGNSERTVW